MGREAPVDRVRRHVFTKSGEAVLADNDDEQVLEFVACGHPLAGHEFRVVDDAGRELPEAREGRLEFRGPSSTSGYFRNPEATAALFDGDWLDTGDFAYLRHGDVYLTGRAKDIIIKAGRNIYPQEIERAVGDIDGVRTGCVAVFGSSDKAAGTEKLVVMAETRATDHEERDGLRRLIEEATSEILGLPPDDVALAPPQAVLKTSSGKIRRAANQAAYESGSVKPRRRAVWMQVARLGVSTIGPEIRRFMRNISEHLFAVWWWLMVGLVALSAWPVVSLIPARRFGQGLVRSGAKFILAMTGTRPRVSGLENLPEGAKVIVCNHSSYMDPLILFAALPGDLGFAAKGELRADWRTKSFVAHLGSLFVERFDTQRSVEDSAHMLDALKSGRSLVVFPEGTLVRMPGLLPFRMGAFMVAAEAAVPVVPVIVSGARSTLRSDSWFPRKTALQVTVSPPLETGGGDWSAAIDLRDRVRIVMLNSGAEPDLAHETGQVEKLKPQE
jgi:1-acyl-sn-glycerol-3-phosphate acyltransferase